MSVLESMRSGTDSTWMQVILAVVVVSFIFWYGKPNGDETAIMARVNGTRIMATDLDRSTRLSLSQRPARTEDEQTVRREQMLGELKRREALRQAAVGAGLVLDYDREAGFSRMVAITRLNNGLFYTPQGPYQAFYNNEGKFDAETYSSLLRNFGYTPDQFESELEREALANKMERLMSLAAVVPEPLLRQAFVDLNTKVDIEYVRVRPSQFNDAVPTDDAAVTAWVAANGGAVEAAYSADFDALYNKPEEVHLRMLRMEVTGDGQGVAELRPRMQSLRDEVMAASDKDLAFADLAAKWSEHPSAEDGGDLDSQKITDLSDAVRLAAADLQVGDVSEVMIGDSDLTLYYLVDRVAAHEVPVEDVRDEIAVRLMREEQAPALAAAFAEDTLALWRERGAAPLAEISAASLATQRTGMVGRDEEQGFGSAPPDMVKVALRSQPGSALPRVFQTGETLWVGGVVARDDADMAEFDAQRAQVREEVMRARRAEFVTGWERQLVEESAS